MQKPITYFILFLIMSGALFYRLDHMRNTPIPSPIRSDAKQYVNYAVNLLQFGTLNRDFTPNTKPQPDSWRTPGYPIFLAAIIKLSGHDNFHTISYYNTLLIQAFIGVLTVLLTFLVARFFLPIWASLLASLLTALSPHLISLENYILTETLFSFFLLLSIYLFFLANRKDKILFYVLAAASFGYSYLINPTVFFVPLIFALIMFLDPDKRNKKNLVRILVFSLVFSLFWGGYAIRNRVSVPPEKKESRLMAAFCSGIYPDFIFKTKQYRYFMYREDPEFPKCQESFGSFTDVLWDRAREQPVKYLKWYLIGKPAAFWNWDIFQGFGDVYIYRPAKSLFNESPLARTLHKAMKKAHPAVLLLLLTGFVFSLVQVFKEGGDRRESVYNYMIFSTLAYFTLMFIAFFSLSRYSIPLRPELYIAACWTLNSISRLFLKTGSP